MANKSRFVIAESHIKAFFKQGLRKVFSEEQLGGILEENRILWNLPSTMSVDKFIDKLVLSEALLKKEFLFNGYLPNKERFVLPDATIFQVAASLISKSYLSHYTAVFLLGLTTQVPKTIYITFEQSKKQNSQRDFKQEAIDAAFSKPHRRSGANAIYEGYTFLIHNGMYSNRAGTYNRNDIPMTNIERTLIDITVRPNYAGGVQSVLDIYKKAVDTLSMNKLVAILNNLNFAYPYHQAIGFYLEKAGLDIKKIDVLRKKEMKFDFYLTYEMQEKEYSNDWKLYYPKGM